MSGERQATPRNASTSLRRGIALLQVVEQHAQGAGGVTTAHLARRLGVHHSSITRLAAPLVEARLLRRNPNSGRYHLGEASLQLGRSYLASLDLPVVAGPHLEALHHRCEATVLLCVPAGTQVECVEALQDGAMTRLGAHVGLRMPAHCTAPGKAMLSVGPPAWIDRVIATGLAAVTGRSITDPSEFRTELARTRKRGFAIDDREFRSDIRALAAPVFGPADQVIAAVVVADLPVRMAPVTLRGNAAQVRAAARAISLGMGAPAANPSTTPATTPANPATNPAAGGHA